MVTSNKKYRFTKVPLNRPREKVVKNFERMPVLYLEYFENKDKVKRELVNKNYAPSPVVSINEERGRGKENNQATEEQGSDSYYDSSSEEVKKNIPLKKKNTKEIEGGGSTSGDEEEEGIIDEIEEEGEGEEYYSDEEVSIEEDIPKKNNKVDDEDEIDNIIKKMMKEVSSDDEEKRERKKRKHSSNNSNNSDDSVLNRKKVPNLNDLENEGKIKKSKIAEDIENFIPKEEELRLKRALLHKFKKLKKSNLYSDEIPNFTIQSDYKLMKDTYDDIFKEIQIESSSIKYKEYLFMGFGAVEGGLAWAGLDMEGYTSAQAGKINEYEMLLMELTEKYSSPSESQWPIEVRLLGIILINTVVFIAIKYFSNKIGANYKSILEPTQQNRHNSNKRKMRGPQINLDDLP